MITLKIPKNTIVKIDGRACQLQDHLELDADEDIWSVCEVLPYTEDDDDGYPD